jgi:hypothetical protein
MFDNDSFVSRTGDAYEGGIGRFFFLGAEMRFD